MKLCYRRQPDVGSAGFHYRKAVAPLKSSGVRCKAAVTASFHYRKAVAPLKCRLVLRRNAAGRRFPLPKGGGPIEGVDSGRGQNRTLSPLSVRMPSCAAIEAKDVPGNGLPRYQNPPRISKGAKLEREAQPVVPPAPHPDMLDVVGGQRVMAQQRGFVRGQIEQRRALARAPDASSRHVPPLRYPFIPAGAALSVRGSSSGRRSRSPRPLPNRSQERLI